MNCFIGVLRKIYRAIKVIRLNTVALFNLPKKTSVISAKEASSVLLKYYKTNEKEVFSGVAQDGFDLDVSVIIPVYNGEKYLKKCLDSVMNQNTKYTYEVICVNDGSTDKSEDILKKYENIEKFRYLNKENGGISSARNSGINHARGRFLLFIDNDDYIAETYLETMMTNALNNHADIVKCGHYSVKIDAVKRAYIEGKNRVIKCDESSEIFKYNGFCWGMLIKKDLFLNACFPVGYWYEDMTTRMILYPQCKIFSYVAQPLYFYRSHGGNASSVVWKSGNYKSFDQYYLTKECINWLEEKKIKFSTGLCLAVQYELCNMLYPRTVQLEDNIKECLFISACELNDRLLQLCPEYQKSGNLIQRRLTLSLINRDYKYWKRICSNLVL